MMKENRVLKDRAMRRRNSRGQFMRDRRNPYGSRGGYVDSRRGRDYAMDSRDYDSEYDGRDYGNGDSRRGYSDSHYGYERYGEHSRPMEYEMYGIGGFRPRDMRMSRDYGDYRDYADYGDMYDRDYAKEKDSYKKDLEEWIEKLKRKETRFGWGKDQVINQAKTMGVKFDEFDEHEFYAIYLALVTDHPKAAAEPRAYLNLAKEWLMDDDTALKGSEKLCAYLYHIVLGEE